MSTEIFVIDKTGTSDVALQVTQFVGPESKGIMLQLAQGLGSAPDEPGFIQLTHRDVKELIPVLLGWLNENDPPGSLFEYWRENYWRYGSSTDDKLSRRAYETAKAHAEKA
jgi:hypothetical protein